jgi:hypothetical protein
VGFGVFSPDLTWSAYYDADAPNVPPVDQSRLYFFNACSVLAGTLKIGGQLGVYGLAGSSLPNIVTDGNHPPSISAALPRRFPTIQLNGGCRALRVVASGGLFPGFPDTAIDLGLDFGGATLANGFQVSIEAAPVTNRQALHAVGSIVSRPGAGIDAGAGIDLDFTGGAISGMTSNVTTSGAGADEGTVLLPPFATSPIAAGALANPVTFPFKLGNSGYSAIAESDDVTTLPSAVTARTQTGCVVNVANPAGALRVLIAQDVS